MFVGMDLFLGFLVFVLINVISGHGGSDLVCDGRELMCMDGRLWEAGRFAC
jgi:hypothetical protein